MAVAPQLFKPENAWKALQVGLEFESRSFFSQDKKAIDGVTVKDWVYEDCLVSANPPLLSIYSKLVRQRKINYKKSFMRLTPGLAGLNGRKFNLKIKNRLKDPSLKFLALYLELSLKRSEQLAFFYSGGEKKVTRTSWHRNFGP